MESVIAVTPQLLTKDATLDDMSTQDYRDVFDELRPIDPKNNKRLSLDKFIERIGSQYSKAQWGQYDNGEKGLTRTMRNELRVACGMPPLPPTVADAVAAQTSPDASVWTDGDGVAHHVILVTSEAPRTFHVNGVVTIEDMSQDDHVTGITERRTRKPTKRYTWPDELEERRARLDADPQEVMRRGIEAMEKDKENNNGI